MTFSILKVDIATAEGGVYLANVAEETHLAISGDRVYFASLIEGQDDEEDFVELRSARLDGSGLLLEEGYQSLSRLARSAAGVYYVSRSTDANTFDDTFSLFFRATGSATWQLLHSGARCTILTSSEFGVVVGKDDDDENTELFLVKGAKQTSLGAAPDNLAELAVTSDAVVALLARLGPRRDAAALDGAGCGAQRVRRASAEQRRPGAQRAPGPDPDVLPRGRKGARPTLRSRGADRLSLWHRSLCPRRAFRPRLRLVRCVRQLAHDALPSCALVPGAVKPSIVGTPLRASATSIKRRATLAASGGSAGP